jgi:hypothetical protein
MNTNQACAKMVSKQLRTTIDNIIPLWLSWGHTNKTTTKLRQASTQASNQTYISYHNKQATSKQAGIKHHYLLTQVTSKLTHKHA